MALTATFAADFTQFEKSLTQATVKLQTFERATKNVNRDLRREIESFSGQKIATEASRIVEAVNRIGGVSRLTETELKRVNAVITETTLKFKALGQEVPPSIAKMNREIQALGVGTTNTTGSLGGFSSVLSKIGPLLPIASVIGLTTAVVRLGTEAFNSAGKIVDLAGKTGLSTTSIQRMQAVANQTGTSLDTFTNAAFKLGINVAEGTERARKAVSGLGLEYDKLRAMKPEEQFATVVKALEQVENVQERNRLGFILFGKQFGEIAPAIAEGYSRIADAATVSSDSQIRALDRAADRWTKFVDDVLSVTQSLLGQLIETIEGVNKAFSSLGPLKFAQAIAVAGVAGKNHIEILTAIGKAYVDLGNDTEQAGNVTTQAAAGTQAWSDQLRQLRIDLLDLTASQRDELDAALKVKGATEEVAAAFGLTTEHLKLYQDQQRGTNAETKTYESSAKKAAKASLDAAAAQKKWNDSIKFFNADIKAINVGGGVQWLATMGQLAPALDDAAAKTAILEATLPPLHASTLIATAGFEEFKRALDDTGTSTLPSFLDNLNDTLRGLPDILQQAFTGGGGFGGAFQALFSGIGKNITESLFGAGGLLNGFGNSLTKGLSNIFGKGIGDAFGMFLPGIGALLGPLIGKLGGFFKDLFGGVSEEVKKARTDLEGFQETLRDTLTTSERSGLQEWEQDIVAIKKAYMALGKTEQEALADAEALWDTDNPERSQAAIERVTEALAAYQKQLEQNTEDANDLFDEIISAGSEGIPEAMRPAIEQLIALGLLTDEQAEKLRGLGDAGALNVKNMEEALGVFAGRMDSLGPAFRQAKIDETAKKYINALDTLIKGGANVGGVLFDAREEITALVRDSLKFGTTIPANMKPWIEELHRTGNLIDENGEAIEDISGLQFGEAMKTEAEIAQAGWDKILKKIQELIDRITGPLQDAIDDIPDEKRIRIGVDFDGIPEDLTRGDFGNFDPPSTGEPVGGSSALRLSGASASLSGSQPMNVIWVDGSGMSRNEVVSTVKSHAAQIFGTGPARVMVRTLARLEQQSGR